MRATGIIRRIDDLGRVVIPREIRRTLRIKEGDPLEIYTCEGGVTFRKYNPVSSVTETLNLLKGVVQEEDDLKCKPDMIQKIKELEALLEEEQANFDKGE